MGSYLPLYSLIPYDRDKAVAYGQKWAYARNPQYYDFEVLGGDCTNFASQCLYAGCGVMNYLPVFGWYYLGLNNRAPAWTGVKYFYNFMTGNQVMGPYGVEADKQDMQIGDFVQLNQGDRYTHTLLVVKVLPGDLLIASHTTDSFNRPLSTYYTHSKRYIHILGARKLI